MVDDDIVGVAATEGVVLQLGDITQPGADEANDDILGVAGIKRVVRQANAVAGRGLPGDCEIAAGDAQRG